MSDLLNLFELVLAHSSAKSTNRIYLTFWLGLDTLWRLQITEDYHEEVYEDIVYSGENLINLIVKSLKNLESLDFSKSLSYQITLEEKQTDSLGNPVWYEFEVTPLTKVNKLIALAKSYEAT